VSDTATCVLQFLTFPSFLLGDLHIQIIRIFTKTHDSTNRGTTESLIVVVYYNDTQNGCYYKLSEE